MDMEKMFSSDHKTFFSVILKPIKRNKVLLYITLSTLLLVEIKVRLDFASSDTETHIPPQRSKTLNYEGDLADLEPDPFFQRWKRHTCRSCRIPDASFLILPWRTCSQVHQLQVIFLINSHHRNIDKRKGIRETWGQRSIMDDLNMDYVFVFGVSGDNSDNPLIQQESRMFGDVVQADFVEQYTNLNLKTFTGLKWATNYCKQARMVIKTDDDMFINVMGLNNSLKEGKFSLDNTIYGNCMSSGYPHRCPFSKWYVPHRFYPYRFFGSFCLGSAFIMSHNAAKQLYEATKNVPYFHVEDVFISSLGGSAAGLAHKQHPGLYMREVAMATCAKNSSYTASLLTESSGFYKLWQQLNLGSCMRDIVI